MEDTYLLNMPSVKKKILSGGAGPMPHFPTGTKVVFHFQTLLDDFERTVIDDSRLAKRPAEIFVGKMFKMEVWESLLTSMRVGEVAEFWCDAVHTGLYPIVSKGMRLIAQGKDPLDGQRHMCGMGNMFHYHSTGYPELDELMRTPQPLIFIMELLQVGDPMSYQRESWMMEKDEKMRTVPLLHMQGNALVKMKRYEDAASKYKEAVLLLKVVQSREMPGDIDYINLGRMVVPLELNYCQCMLELEQYYEVIEHTSELLEKHKDCVKGYYKRAKAHAAVWNEKEARRDFNMVLNLDLTLAPLVHRELRELSDLMKEKYWEEKEQYWQKLENSPCGRDVEESSEEEEEEEEEGGGDKEEEEKERGMKENDMGEEGGRGQSASVAMKDRGEGEDVRKEGACQGEEGEGGDQEARRGTETQRERVAGGHANPEGMDWQQMLRMVMFLQDEGIFHMKENRYEDAVGKFREAMEYVDFLQYKLVDQKGEDWQSLEKVRLPLTLNLSGCMLELHQYQHVVELNTKLLKKHKGNCKAVYQRARAHSALCNEEQARADFLKLERLDPKFQPVVRRELKKLGENLRSRHGQQKKTYWETSREKWGLGGTRARAAAAGGTPKKCVTFATGEQPQEHAGSEEAVGSKEAKKGEAPASADAGLDGAERERHKADVKLEEEEEWEDTRVESHKEEEEDEDEEDEDEEEEEEEAEHSRVESNGLRDGDSVPAPTSAAKDNVPSKRSGFDKARNKVKCPSTAVQGQGTADRGNKAATRSDAANGSKLSQAISEPTGEVEHRPSQSAQPTPSQH
ncbi:unnamed protein product [Lota lota]